MKCIANGRMAPRPPCIFARLSKELATKWGNCVARLGDLIDWPPLWLALSLGAVRGVDQMSQWFLWSLFGPDGRIVGGVLVAMGLALMFAAAVQMLALRTTVIPRSTPAVLVTSGLFRVTRNPIYLGDALVLAGAILWWDVALGLPVLLGFMALIQHRFILPEEAVLQARFGAAFDAWRARVPRWIGPGGRS